MLHSALFEYDSNIRNGLDGYLCGVDEAGRGPLAGPVCCAAVILKPYTRIDGLNDSKKMTEKARNKAFHQIIENSICCGISFVDNETIDAINILKATMFGMAKAAYYLKQKPSLILVDGNTLPKDLPCNGKTVVHGDAVSASVAAASVLAKVTRDRYMIWLDTKYPEYCFAKHKGYATKQHYELIEQFGITSFHRKSFLKEVLKV